MKILKITGISLLVLIVALFAIPYLFKGKIVSLVKEQINKNINATVDFKDVELSAFRQFPKLSLSLQQLSVVGQNEFINDTLVAAKNLSVAVNWWGAVTGDAINVYKIIIEEPRIHAIVTKEGKANWNIMKPATTETSDGKGRPFKMTLNEYSITNGYISYIDNSGNMSSEIWNINHSGKGDFTADNYTLKTNTVADAVTFIYGGIPYFNKVKTTADFDVEVDAKTSKFTFNTDRIMVNDLKLSTNGYFQFLNDTTYGMDINFKSPSTDFKTILSLVPGIYQNNFASIKTSGEASFNGFVKGSYNSKQIPSYQLNLNVSNGSFQYPDLPEPVKNINVIAKVNNPDGITDHTVVNIEKGHIEMAGEPFDFKIIVKTPMSDLWIDAAAKGKLDLSKVTKFIKLQEGTQLTGLLNANATVTGYTSAIQRQQFDKFNADGTIALDNFFYASKEYPSGVKLSNFLMTFNPKNVAVNNVAGQFLKTNFSANGYVNNLLPYMLKNQALEGVMNIKADNINLNDWMGISSDTVAKKSSTHNVFMVPANLNLTLNANADKVTYDKTDLTALSGSLLIADETVKINNAKAYALDGQLAISGFYSTKLDRKKPDISLTYDVKAMDIQKTFFAFNTIQKIMPIGQFLAGKLNSQFTMKGKLGDNMMPDMNSLTGNGNLLLIEGILSKFQPVEKLAQTLNISSLQKISLKDLKSYFEFTNGKVLVKPFNVKSNGIDMEIGGIHGFDQSLDYTINMKIPRALMGAQGNNFVNNLAAQISSKGLPLQLSEIIPLQIKLGGFIKSPTIKTDLKQSANSLTQDLKQQATQFVQNKIDSTKKAVTNAVNDTIKSVKQQAANAAKDEINKIISGKKDTSTNGNDPKKKIEDAGKGLLNNLNPFKKKG